MRKGFTLIEVSLAVLVFIVVLTSLLSLYISFIKLSEDTLATTRAFFSAQKMMETIRGYNFNKIKNDFDGYTFTPEGFSSDKAKGIVYVTEEEGRSDLLRVNIVICFKSGERIIGEDLNLNGNLDIGEDKNNNDMLDSPVEITTLITSR